MTGAVDLDFRIVLENAGQPAAGAVEQVFAGRSGPGGAAADESGIAVAQTRSGRVPGAFDMPFYVGVALSVPIGVTTGLLANWIFMRLTEARAKAAAPTLTLMLEGMRIEVHEGDIEGSAEVVAHIRDALAPLQDRLTPPAKP